MTETPKSLLHRLRQPTDASAWDRFVELYTPLLYRWALQLGLQAADAADLVQELFVVLLRRLPHFEYDPAGSFRAWLKKVTRDLWKQRCRQLAVRNTSPLDAQPEPAVDDPAEAFWEREYQRQVVQRALELIRTDFEEKTWRACVMTVMDGVPAAEVAALLGLRLDSVYTARSRVLRRLREELSGMLD